MVLSCTSVHFLWQGQAVPEAAWIPGLLFSKVPDFWGCSKPWSASSSVAVPSVAFSPSTFPAGLHFTP